jgi:hypothetical protein
MTRISLTTIMLGKFLSRANGTSIKFRRSSWQGRNAKGVLDNLRKAAIVQMSKTLMPKSAKLLAIKYVNLERNGISDGGIWIESKRGSS